MSTFECDRGEQAVVTVQDTHDGGPNFIMDDGEQRRPHEGILREQIAQWFRLYDRVVPQRAVGHMAATARRLALTGQRHACSATGRPCSTGWVCSSSSRRRSVDCSPSHGGSRAEGYGSVAKILLQKNFIEALTMSSIKG